MRQAELLGLRREDVDLEAARLVRVQRQYLPRTGMVERRTKAYRQDRPVELTDTEVTVLREHRRRQAEERLAAGELWRDHGLVFPSEVGTPLHPRNLLRWFQGLLARAGLPRVRFHDLRHTAATLLLRSDGRVLVAQQRLGHRDPATTTRFYGHVLPGDQRAAAERALDALRAAGATDLPAPGTRRARRDG
jgi:integrase